MLDATTLPITYENTRLRPLSELDADTYAAGTKDEAVRRFGHLPEPDYTPESPGEKTPRPSPLFCIPEHGQPWIHQGKAH